jgi:probable HAF family extracellular repeat protein
MDVSADGSVLTGWSSSTAGWEAFHWSNGVMTGLGDVPGADVNSQGRSISANGNVIVGNAEPASNLEIAMHYAAGTMTELGHIGTGAGRSSADGISDDGSIIVGAALDIEDPNRRWKAFRWESGTMVVLGDVPLGLTYDKAIDVSGDGTVIIGNQIVDDVYEAFRYEGGVRTGLGDLPGGAEFSLARGVSADGSRIVGLGYTAAGPDVFVWTEGEGMISLAEAMTLAGIDLSGWSSLDVLGLSADGNTIVGQATHNGNNEAWRVQLAPAQTAVPSLANPGLVVLGLLMTIVVLRLTGHLYFGPTIAQTPPSGY